jgi:hypothetical protein
VVLQNCKGKQCYLLAAFASAQVLQATGMYLRKCFVQQMEFKQRVMHIYLSGHGTDEVWPLF